MEALRQLQGFEIPANAWERHILGRRVAGYEGAMLDQLCLSGAVGWGRLSPHPAMIDGAPGEGRRIVPTSVAPVTFFLREDCAWMPHRPHEESDEGRLSEAARQLFQALSRRGALFFNDLLRVTGLLKAEIELGLWELVAAGLVTADGYDNLRALISRARRNGRQPRPRQTAGRWSLLASVTEAASLTASGEHAGRSGADERAEATCRLLLARYGIVFRELLARESNMPRWRELQWAFRRMEDRGEVRGGRFVSGFVGEQFALPIAVESVRQMRTLPPSAELITISAADPLNLAGIIVPGERVPAITSRTVSFRNGVYVAEEAGNLHRLAAAPSDEDAVDEAAV
jgi:ATP-dependent Lhr-like helicase